MANECLNVCGPTRFVIPACRAACATAHPVRPEWPSRGHPESTREAGPERVRVWHRQRRVRRQLQDGLGVTPTRREWLRHEAGETRRSRGSRQAASDRFALADLRHEGACRLLADGVDIRIIQLMLGHASLQQTQRYLNVTDEELRKGLEVSWKRRTLKAVAGGQNA